MSQEDFIHLLQEGCKGLDAKISRNMVFNINPGSNAPEYIKKTSSQWKKFVNDVETYFAIYQDDDLKSKAQDLLNCSTIDQTWIGEMDAFLHGLANQLLLTKAQQTSKTTKPVQSIKGHVGNHVFIVHGHDTEAQVTVARTLEKLGFIPIILHEQASEGKTIIEKIEKYSDVDFAIVLYTPCDLGREKEDPPNKEKPRARQNVVFEHGYLIGKLGRNHVCALVKGNTETPGDMSGIVYIKMDEGGGWKLELGKEMKSAGLSVDLNKL